MSTPSPYLRDRLLQAADGLRKDAETARLNLADAEQDVAAARALLAEAEAQAARARAEVDSISRGIAWLEREAAHLAPGPDPDPAEQLRATGLMREEPNPVDPAPPAPAATLYQDNGLPMVWDPSVPPGGYVCAATDGDGICGMPVESEPCDRPHAHQYIAGIGDPRCLCGNLWPCDGHGDTPDDLTAPGVADSRAEVAPHLPPPVPHEPAGVPVATHGPLMTMPDTGLAPAPLEPAAPTTEPRHARPPKPGLIDRIRRTGGHPIIRDEQGDQQ